MTTNGYNMTERVSTEWEDALVKHKIIERKAKAPTQDVVDTQIMWDEKEKEQHQYDNKTLKQLDELEDEIEENTLEALRKKRLSEMKEKAKGDRFGYIKQIGKPEYEEEVTNASKNIPVICCLFMYGQEASKIMLGCLEKVASKFKSVKFVKIIGNECIPNYPDKFCPTLVIYKDGDTVGNIKGLYNFGGKNGISADIVEWELSELGILKSTLEENPRKFKMKRGKASVYYTNSNNDNLSDRDDNDNDNNNNDDSDDSLDID